MKNLKRLVVWSIALCLLAAMLPLTVFASTVDSGTCGDNVIWSLDDEGVLTISGTGAMKNYMSSNSLPWKDYRFSITQVIIEYGVTTIGNCAFQHHTNLANIMIPDSVESIGSEAFYGCYYNLETVDIPDNVKTIGSHAFYNCTNLKSIIIPDSVESIGNYAFNTCPNLASITIGAGVTSIGNYALYNCTGLNEILVDEDNAVYSSDSFGVLFNKSKTTLIHTPAKLAGSYTIPNSVIEIGYKAFCDCTSLTDVTIPEGINIIGDYAFNNCTGLKSITIPDGVTAIGNSTFYNCSSLTSVTIPNGVESIGVNAFFGCSGLTDISIPDGVKSIGNDAFSGCSGLTRIIIPDSVKSIGETAFNECISLKSITIPDSVESVGKWAFAYCSNLTSITIPDGVDSIGSFTFYYCTSLVSIKLPSSITDIAMYAFSNCTKLTTVVYGGTEQQKNNITIGSNNDELKNAQWKYATGNENETFADVSTTSWQYSAVSYAVDNNLMAGKGTDADGRIKFDPNSHITREEFVQVLYNAEGKPSVSIANKFPDVAAGGWYKNAVLWANSKNIANGMGNGNFGVGKNITRQDLALMLYKYAAMKNLDLNAPTSEINKYADGSQVSGYAQTAMNWAVKNGVLSGKGTAGQPLSNFRLDPAGTATRAECAAMLKNFMEAFKV